MRMACAENVTEWNLLHYYIRYAKGGPQEEVMNRRLHLGADINELDDGGSTVLNCATQLRNIKVVKFLIEKGADVNAYNIEYKNMIPLSKNIRNAILK